MHSMRTTCARDNLMPACGSPSICNLGVVRRRSFTAAAPEVAILAQSLSDGTLLTRVVCETAGCDFLFVVPLRLRSFDGSASPQCSKLVFSSQLLRFPSRSTSLILTVFRTTCRRISLLSLTTSLFLLPLPASSVMGTRLFWASLSLRLAVLLSAHALAVCDRLGPRVLPVSGLPRLQLSVPFLFGLPPLPTLVLRSPHGGSCRHDLFISSVHCIFLQCALLPSTHSLRMPGSVSPFLRRPLPFLHTGLRPRPDPLLAAFEHLDIPIDFNAPPVNSLNSLCVPERSPPIFPLCCADICGPPDWMEWSPIHPSAQGSSSAWVLQWVCRSCESSTSMQDIPVLPAVSCPECSSSAAIVFDRPTGRVVLRFLSTRRPSRRCQSLFPPAPPLLPLDWFSHGPLSRFPSLNGWHHGDLVLALSLGSSVPLISLGLAPIPTY